MFKLLIFVAIVYFAVKFFRKRYSNGYRKGYRKFSSSDFRHRSSSRHFGHSHYKKKHTSHSFFSS